MLFLRFLGFAFFCCLSANAFSQAQQPNILLIIADDMGIDITPGYQQSNLLPNTPNLDQLRAEGITFDNHWAAPSCTPTRAAIMSAKYGVKTGALSPPGNLGLEHESLFAALARETNNAYAAALIGKWHISSPQDPDHPAQHGVDHYEGIFSGAVDDYYNWEKTTNGTTSQVTEYATSHLTTAAVNWIDDQSEPWFLWLAYNAPHSPYHDPPEELYTSGNNGSNSRRFVAAIEAMDTEIGRLLSSLSAEERANTTIFFVGDNGTPGNVAQNFPQGHAKGSLYQGGVLVPFIAAGAHVNRTNEREDQLTHVADVHATVLELAGVDLPGGVYNSRSLKDLLSATVDLQRPFNYVDNQTDDGIGFAIRDERYKLISYDTSGDEFYDLDTDPFEENNLIGNLTMAQQNALEVLRDEAQIIRTDWSCQDGIQNGNETDIDFCTEGCACMVTATEDQSTALLNLQLSPNPTNGSAFIKTATQQAITVELYNSIGQHILTLSGNGEVMLPKQTAGTYFAYVTIDDQRTTRQIIWE